MSLLHVDNISKTYRNQVVLDGVSLRVERGERLALVGPNGAGKTTLLRIVMGLATSDSGKLTIARQTKIGYLSQDLQEIQATGAGKTAPHYEQVYSLERRLRQLEAQMGALEPDSRDQKRLMAEYSRLTAQYERMDGYNVEVTIKKHLYHLGLRFEALSTPVEKLSGGERMRVAVARILLEEPDLLLLDEPTNHLDIGALEWFERFLRSFKGGILFVSHDRYFLDRVATRIAELEHGTIIARSGTFSEFMQHKQQLAEFVANEQQRLRWTIKNMRKTVQGLKSQRKSIAVRSKERQLEKLNAELDKDLSAAKHKEHLFRQSAPKISFKKKVHLSKKIAWADQLQKQFGDVVLFDDASFRINGGERVGIIGPNGCGKTTLINMLLGNDQDYGGTCTLGRWVNHSYMGQEVLFEDEDLNLLQMIADKRDGTEQEIRSHLARFQFYGDDVEKRVKILSGGERVRLYLACVILEDTDCLILDEPTNHLDMMARTAVEQALSQFKGTTIAVTHDRYFLTNSVSKILEIDGGKIHTYQGNYEKFRERKYGREEQIAQVKPPKPRRQTKSQHEPTRPPGPDPERIEAEIISLEEQAKTMESDFDEHTSWQQYKAYSDLLREIDGLYEQWGEALR